MGRCLCEQKELDRLATASMRMAWGGRVTITTTRIMGRLRYAMRTVTSALPRENRRGSSFLFLACFWSKKKRGTGAMRTAGDTHGVSERRVAKRRSSRSDRSERLAWQCYGLCGAVGYGTREGGVRPKREDGEQRSVPIGNAPSGEMLGLGDGGWIWGCMRT